MSNELVVAILGVIAAVIGFFAAVAGRRKVHEVRIMSAGNPSPPKSEAIAEAIVRDDIEEERPQGDPGIVADMPTARWGGNAVRRGDHVLFMYPGTRTLALLGFVSGAISSVAGGAAGFALGSNAQDGGSGWVIGALVGAISAGLASVGIYLAAHALCVIRVNGFGEELRPPVPFFLMSAGLGAVGGALGRASSGSGSELLSSAITIAGLATAISLVIAVMHRWMRLNLQSHSRPFNWSKRSDLVDELLDLLYLVLLVYVAAMGFSVSVVAQSATTWGVLLVSCAAIGGAGGAALALPGTFQEHVHWYDLKSWRRTGGRGPLV